MSVYSILHVQHNIRTHSARLSANILHVQLNPSFACTLVGDPYRTMMMLVYATTCQTHDSIDELFRSTDI